MKFRAFVILLALATLSRKVYTHQKIWTPAHLRAEAALQSGNISEASTAIGTENQLALCGINPVWFITGGC